MSPTSYQAAPPRVRNYILLLCYPSYCNWLRRPDLNRRPSGYEPDELPGCSTPRPSLQYCFHREVFHHTRAFTSASNWLRGPDLNRRPSGYEPDELPGCSTPRPMRANYTLHENSCNPFFEINVINHPVTCFSYSMLFFSTALRQSIIFVDANSLLIARLLSFWR